MAAILGLAALAEEAEPAPMGLIGAELSFLDQEIKVIKERKKLEQKRKEMKNYLIKQRIFSSFQRSSLTVALS